MARRKIITVNDDIEFLRKTSKPVTEFDSSLHQLLDDMWETVRHYEGAGLSAVQIGVLKRVFIMNIQGSEHEFINPEITNKNERTKKVVEGCLSVPKKWGKVERPISVKVKAQDRNGNWFTHEFKGFRAQCVCHEYDHLDGKLYTDFLVNDEEE